MWSLQISRREYEAEHKAAVSVFIDLLSFSDQQRLTGSVNSSWDINLVEKIPTPAFDDRLPELIQVLSTHLPETELSYCWGLVRDHLGLEHEVEALEQIRSAVDYPLD